MTEEEENFDAYKADVEQEILNKGAPKGKTGGVQRLPFSMPVSPTSRQNNLIKSPPNYKDSLDELLLENTSRRPAPTS